MNKWLVPLCLILIACSNGAKYPEIRDGKVFFMKGKKIDIQNGKISRTIEGRGQASYSEDVIIQNSWSRVIIEKTNALPEMKGVTFCFYDNNGEIVGCSEEYWGESRRIISERAKLVMLFMHYGFSDDHRIILIDSDGKEKARFEIEVLPYKADFTEDGSLIWVVSHARPDENVDISGAATSEYKNRLSEALSKVLRDSIINGNGGLLL